jgi:5-methyltetrahydrofolate--homocysteine methyltransferase
LDDTTGWLEPILTDDRWDIRKLQSCFGFNQEGKSKLSFRPQNRWWKFTLDWLKRGAVEAAGKSIPSIGAFGGSGDTLASLRGTLNLLYDIADTPEKVREADEYLMEIWFQLYDTFYEIVHEASDGGTTCWYPIWAPGKMYAVQNDFSYMISPQMFREVFLPVIERQTEFLDYSIYHVDGVEAFAHVPALCELPKLQALQILPGAGKPSPLHYLETLKIAQAAEKNLHLGIPIQEVEPALKMLSAKGLFIQTSAATEAEARQLLQKVETWSKVE